MIQYGSHYIFLVQTPDPIPDPIIDLRPADFIYTNFSLCRVLDFYLLSTQASGGDLDENLLFFSFFLFSFF